MENGIVEIFYFFTLVIVLYLCNSSVLFQDLIQNFNSQFTKTNIQIPNNIQNSNVKILLLFIDGLNSKHKVFANLYKNADIFEYELSNMPKNRLEIIREIMTGYSKNSIFQQYIYSYNINPFFNEPENDTLVFQWKLYHYNISIINDHIFAKLFNLPLERIQYKPEILKNQENYDFDNLVENKIIEKMDTENIIIARFTQLEAILEEFGENNKKIEAKLKKLRNFIAEIISKKNQEKYNILILGNNFLAGGNIGKTHENPVKLIDLASTLSVLSKSQIPYKNQGIPLQQNDKIEQNEILKIPNEFMIKTMTTKICLLNEFLFLINIGIMLYLVYRLKTMNFVMEYLIIHWKIIIFITLVLGITWKFNDYFSLLLEITMILIFLTYNSVNLLIKHIKITEKTTKIQSIVSFIIRISIFLIICLAFTTIENLQNAVKYIMISIAIFSLSEKYKIQGISLKDIILLLIFSALIKNPDLFSFNDFLFINSNLENFGWLFIVKFAIYLKLLDISRKCKCKAIFITMNFCFSFISDLCLILFLMNFWHIKELIYFFIALHMIFMAFCIVKSDKLIFYKIDDNPLLNNEEEKKKIRYDLVRIYCIFLWISQCFINIIANLFIENLPVSKIFKNIAVFSIIHIIYMNISGKKQNFVMNIIFAIVSIGFGMDIFIFKNNASDIENTVKTIYEPNLLNFMNLIFVLSTPFLIGYLIFLGKLFENNSAKVKLQKSEKTKISRIFS